MGAINIRPCAVLIENGSVLCIRVKYDEEFYLFPGGGVESGETLSECVVREMKEETGLDVAVEKLVYVNDWIANKETNDRVMNMFFLVKRTGGEILQGEKDGGKVKHIEWVPLDRFEEIDFRPKTIALRLKKDYEKDFCKVPYFN